MLPSGILIRCTGPFWSNSLCLFGFCLPSLQCLISALTQAGGGDLLFRFASSVQSCYREGGALQTDIAVCTTTVLRTVSSPQEEILYPSPPPPPLWQLWPYFLSLCTERLFILNISLYGVLQHMAFVSGFLYLALRIQVHPCGNIHKRFISFYGWIIFHCMINHVNVYSFINWWTWVVFLF